MNDDMLPVGTTVHIKPEDIKWNGGDLISREELLFAIRQQLAFQKEKAALTTIDADKMSHSLVATGIQLAIDIIDNAPTVSIQGQKLGCEICVNRNIKSKEVCTSPFGECKFFNCG